MTTRNHIIPNSFQTPNFNVDVLMELLTGDEYKVLDFTVRHIFGWQQTIIERQNRISLTMYTDGYTTQNGVRFGGTGLSRTAIISITKELAKYRVLIKVGRANNDGTLWRVGEEPDIEGLRARSQEKKEDNRKRTTKARQAAAEVHEPQAGGLSDRLPDERDGWSVGQTTGGLSDRPEVVYGTDSNKPIETHETHLSSSGDEGASSTPTVERERDEIFNYVAEHVFGVDPHDVGSDGGRIGMIVAFLRASTDRFGRGKTRIEKLSAPARLDHVRTFVTDWLEGRVPADGSGKTFISAGTALPQDVEKFALHWKRWARYKARQASRRTAEQENRPPVDETPRMSAEEIDAIKAARKKAQRRGETDDGGSTL
ncbi:MAG: hypothetical protein OHK0046_46390 [Anaerolineae bacterium]